jgi:hypothetical protein
MWRVGPKFSQKCVPTYKIHNTTRGTLLVIKMCTKLVVYSSHSRCFDGWIFVVRTVDKLPQAKRLLVLEQSLDSVSVDQELHGCYYSASIDAQFHTLLAIWKYWYERNLALFLPVRLVTFNCAFRGWRVERFWLCITHSSLFWILSWSFEIFVKKRQFSLDGSLDRSSGVCYLTKGFWMSLNFILYGLYVELWAG